MMNKDLETKKTYIEKIISAIDLLLQWDELEQLAREEHDEWEHGKFVMSERDCQQRSEVEAHIFHLIQNANIRGISKEDLRKAGVAENYLWAIS